jgi:predicted O-methyltransferase YrrM
MIPLQYWKGEHSLELEYPWLTPESIQCLIYFCKPSHDILEFGSGGSTLFFAGRAQSITSFETQKDWYQQVVDRQKTRNISNIDVHLVHTIDECHTLTTGKLFEIALIDCVIISRLAAVQLAYEHLRPGGIIVVDNYAADYCQGIKEFLNDKTHSVDYYNDLHWAGKGTAVYYLPSASK